MEKTHAPSPKRLRKARREGNIPRSQYLSQSLIPLVGLLICILWLANSWVDLRLLVECIWGGGLRNPEQAVRIIGIYFFELTLKLLAVISLICLITELVQVGPILELSLLAPKFSRFGPVSAAKRLIESVKRSWLVVLRFIVLILACSWFFYVLIAGLEELIFLPLNSLAQVFYTLAIRLVLWAGGLTTVFAVLDYFVQRRSWFRNVGMSIEDLKREHKEEEGDPMLRSIRKYRHKELLQLDLIKRIRSAKVVIVERSSGARS